MDEQPSVSRYAPEYDTGQSSTFLYCLRNFAGGCVSCCVGDSGRNRQPKDAPKETLIGRIFVACASFLFLFIAFIALQVIYPLLHMSQRRAELLLTVGMFTYFNMLSSYFGAVLTDPGRPPNASEFNGTACSDGDKQMAVCEKCSRVKPNRAHHCRSCGRCTMRMDHHCPWVNNCVGLRNQHYFALFLFYLSLCCGLVIVFFLDFAIDAVFYPQFSPISSKTVRACVALSWIASLIALIALSFVGTTQLYMILTNQTMIELLTNSRTREQARFRRDFPSLLTARQNAKSLINPYDRGLVENFQEVFGNGFLACCFTCLFPVLAPLPHQKTFVATHESSAPAASDSGKVRGGFGLDREEVIFLSVSAPVGIIWLVLLGLALVRFFVHAWRSAFHDTSFAGS
eukprot:TRINITY_DN15816_c0_g2_i1.p1 TRINITY_DN15816_c0_g2~~TRINITY_DN15816_c0_g2_i1.p1  ORF type:complete len:400 (-),score=26.39 TRINITY_DN15816_c0_g2_i1:119-1318(-)